MSAVLAELNARQEAYTVNNAAAREAFVDRAIDEVLDADEIATGAESLGMTLEEFRVAYDAEQQRRKWLRQLAEANEAQAKRPILEAEIAERVAKVDTLNREIKVRRDALVRISEADHKAAAARRSLIAHPSPTHAIAHADLMARTKAAGQVVAKAQAAVEYSAGVVRDWERRHAAAESSFTKARTADNRLALSKAADSVQQAKASHAKAEQKLADAKEALRLLDIESHEWAEAAIR